jgi:hypothetical protein
MAQDEELVERVAVLEATAERIEAKLIELGALLGQEESPPTLRGG